MTLTVTDSGNLSAQATLIVSVNNTPPNVTITSPVNGTLYSPFNQTTVNLTATVSDAESSDSQLLYQWQVLLHHNDHNHGSPVDTHHATTAVIEPTGCDGINIYYYRILLTVTDPQGLATTREVRLYPDCGPNTPPTISNIPDQTIFQNSSTGPIAFTVGDAETCSSEPAIERGVIQSGAGTQWEYCIWRQRRQSHRDCDTGGRTNGDCNDHRDGERRAEQYQHEFRGHGESRNLRPLQRRPLHLLVW